MPIREAGCFRQVAALYSDSVIFACSAIDGSPVGLVCCLSLVSLSCWVSPVSAE